MGLFAIGDIHGCFDPLMDLFEKDFLQSDDTIIFLGDYVDRGPKSNHVLDWLIRNPTNCKFEFLIGNHDLMMLAAKEEPARLNEWLRYGGKATLKSYGLSLQPDWVDHIPQEHWDFLKVCKPYIEKDKFLFVHAGFQSEIDLEHQSDHALFWKKYENPDKFKLDKTVICGHTSRKDGEIADFGHTICIDTYAYGGGWLTCLNVEDKTYLKTNNYGRVDSGKLN